LVNPIDPPLPEIAEACAGLAAPARGHVYIFFVNGLDPVNLSNLSGLRDYVQDLGFPKTYFGHLYHTPWFAKELRRIHDEDPAARFVLVGFSLGSPMAHALAQSARDADVNIDLLVYLSGNLPWAPPASRPPNVERVITIIAGSPTQEGSPVEGTDEYYLTDAWYFGTPAHRQTLQALGEELVTIASRIPIAMPPPPVAPVDLETAPSPRPLPPEEDSGRDEWDFLKLEVELPSFHPPNSQRVGRPS